MQWSSDRRRGRRLDDWCSAAERSRRVGSRGWEPWCGSAEVGEPPPVRPCRRSTGGGRSHGPSRVRSHAPRTAGGCLVLRSSNPVQKDGLCCPHSQADGALTSNDPRQSICTAFEERSTSLGYRRGPSGSFNSLPSTAGEARPSSCSPLRRRWRIPSHSTRAALHRSKR